MNELALWQGRFRDHLQLRGYAERTVEMYTDELRLLFGFLEGLGLTQLGQVGRPQLEDYRSHLCFEARTRGRALTRSTQARRLAAVKAFFQFLARDHYAPANPAAALELPRHPKGLPRTLLSEAEVTALLEVACLTTPLGLRNRALVEVLYGTGLRNSEVCSLTLPELDLARQEIRLRQGKGGKGRIVPLGDQALAWLRRYLQEARPELVFDPRERHLFLTLQGGPLNRHTLREIVRSLAEQAELGKPVTPHTLRHACATHMLGRGAGLRHLQRLLGHESVSTTQRYAHLDVSDLRSVLLRCHPRERPA